MTEQIRKIRVQNFKGIREVELSVEGQSCVEIAGENGQGKSSLLDAIEAAICGASSAPEKSLRIGSDEGEILLETDTLRITRKINSEGLKSLKLERIDTGAPIGKPQSFLDEIFGKFALDPLRFSRLSAKDQAEELINLMGKENRDALLSLDIDLKNAEEERLSLSRELKRKGSPAPVEAVKPFDLSEIMAEQAEAIAWNTEQDRRERLAENARKTISDLMGKIYELENKIREMKSRVEEENKNLSELPEAEPWIDLGLISQKLAGATDQNAQADRYQDYLRRKSEREALEKKHRESDERVKNLRASRESLFASAKLPIKGALVTENGIEISGKPFSDLCSKEQIMASALIAMALQPRLKVLIVREGSLLDNASFAALSELAKKRGYQVLIESVGKGHGEAVILSEGRIVTA